jgi:hypothetical protein
MQEFNTAEELQFLNVTYKTKNVTSTLGNISEECLVLSENIHLFMKKKTGWALTSKSIEVT